MPISPLLGIVIGGAFTIIAIVFFVIVRVRRAQTNGPEAEQKVLGGGANLGQNLSSTKPLLRSASPRDCAGDERDPDVIPAKYGNYMFLYFKLVVKN